MNTIDGKGILLGVTYLVQLNGEYMCYNRFVLIESNNKNESKIVWKYDKAHPVPLVESNIISG